MIGHSGSLAAVLDKAPSGIAGLDELLEGGFPRGRASLICGGPGCGKTLLALEFILRGARDLGEPGVFVSFEESNEELSANVASFGFDLGALVADGLIALDQVDLTSGSIEEVGEYDLEALLLRIGFAIDSVDGKRIAIDSIEALFASLSDEAVLRSELRRLLRRLKDRGQTVVITGERGSGMLTRHGIEEYVSDCVIFLDNRVNDQVSTRRMRVVKYRGSAHGANEYPFVIDDYGLAVIPVTSLRLDHPASAERVSSGISALDDMLSGGGYYRGSTVLLTGAAGTGKSSISAHFAAAACSRGERCLYLLYEESPDQFVRNLRSIGLDLAPWVERGLLVLHGSRPTHSGLEQHLATVHRLVRELEPQAVVIDPASNLDLIGGGQAITEHHLRQLDLFKSRGITTLATVLTDFGLEQPQLGISSLADTWLALRLDEVDGELNRTLRVVKSRGMAHSKQIREYVLSDSGVEIVDVYLGKDGILTGSARLKQEQRDREDKSARLAAYTAEQRAFDRLKRRTSLEIEQLQSDLARAEAELVQADALESAQEADRTELQTARGNGRTP